MILLSRDNFSASIVPEFVPDIVNILRHLKNIAFTYQRELDSSSMPRNPTSTISRALILEAAIRQRILSFITNSRYEDEVSSVNVLLNLEIT